MRLRMLGLSTLGALCLAVPSFSRTPGHHPFFDRLDTNADGFLAKEEVLARFPRFTDEMFKLADTNHDGRLDVAEWQAFVRSKRGAGKNGGI